jgi:hypothetical protein
VAVSGSVGVGVGEWWVGVAVGGVDGVAVGGVDGVAVGGVDGVAVGGVDGVAVGGVDGVAVGGVDGVAVGGVDGVAVGGLDGVAVGGLDGVAVGHEPAVPFHAPALVSAVQRTHAWPTEDAVTTVVLSVVLSRRCVTKPVNCALSAKST